MPAVSVIIPAYRTTEYIAEALDSVFAQTFRDFEAIVVNDGCPDTERLERVLEPYRSRIRYIRKENGGPGSARNAGILAAGSPLVAMLDSDDVWAPDYLAVHAAMFEQDPELDVVSPNAVFFGDTPDAGRTLREYFPCDCEVSFLNVLTRRCVLTGLVAARRDTLIRAGLYDEQFAAGEDLELWLRILKMGGRIRYHDQALVRYRSRRGSQMRGEARTLDQVRLVLEKVRDTYELDDAERRAVERELELNFAAADLEEGKRALYARDWRTARAKLVEANRCFRRLKIGLAAGALGLAPTLLGPFVRRGLR